MAQSKSTQQDDTVDSPEHVARRRLPQVAGRLGEGRHQVRRGHRRAARRVPEDATPSPRRSASLTDLGLTPVSSAAVLPDIWITGDARAASLDTWKRRCEQFATIGLQKIYCPSITNRRVTAEDFKATPGCIREAGDIAKQFNLTAMIEFARTSTHLSTLRSSLTVIREAAHTNVRPMLDFFHFWSGHEQVRRSRHDPPGRDRARALPGHPRHAARADGQQRPRDSRRRRRSGGGDPEKAGGEAVLRAALGGAVPDGAAAGRSVRGRQPDQTEVRSGDAKAGVL